MTKRIQVRLQKLGREKALGEAYFGENLIRLDPRQRSRVLLNTAVHECLHLCWPDASERKVSRAAGQIADVLHRIGFRRVAP